MAEHFLGKEEVKGSIPFNGSILVAGLTGAWGIVDKTMNLPAGRECDARKADSSNAAGFIIGNKN